MHFWRLPGVNEGFGIKTAILIYKPTQETKYDDYCQSLQLPSSV
jgi:hypothetical protein